jgi:formamidopyrimidine-DNA glycosylase
VETVRAGLQRWVVGRRIKSVAVAGERTLRRHVAGADDFVARLTGRRFAAARRRGKYLWLPLDDGTSLLAHLGMSGQFLAVPANAAAGKHLRARWTFDDDGPELRFHDQRTFGGLALAELVEADGTLVPSTIAHIARDPMDPGFDPDRAVRALRSRRTEVKRALLDQTLVSGIGNIYADEALWRARLHGTRPVERLTRAQGTVLLASATEVMAEALRAGGTSFDSLYVNINGQSGYFERSLNVYGRGDRPCRRCGTPIRREPFMNRSSYFCPRCQPKPRSSR